MMHDLQVSLSIDVHRYTFICKPQSTDEHNLASVSQVELEDGDGQSEAPPLAKALAVVCAEPAACQGGDRRRGCGPALCLALLERLGP